VTSCAAVLRIVAGASVEGEGGLRLVMFIAVLEHPFAARMPTRQRRGKRLISTVISLIARDGRQRCARPLRGQRTLVRTLCGRAPGLACMVGRQPASS